MRNQRIPFTFMFMLLLIGISSVMVGCKDGSRTTPTPKARATAVGRAVTPTAEATGSFAVSTAGAIVESGVPTVAVPPAGTALPTTASGSQQTLAIMNPVDGQKVVMTISVEVQATNLGDSHLSVWVRPIPADPAQKYWSQDPPVETIAGIWKSSPVYVGQETDPSGLPFRICAVVTRETYSRGQQTNELPQGPRSCVNVTRQQ
jgi:hypothetical protein